MARVAFKEQYLRAREDAIVDAVNLLLAEKGYDLMTVDEVAASVGIAKASLYKHFASKEALAAAAMVRVLQRVLDFTQQRAADHHTSPLEHLKAVARWALHVQLAGQMPSLPAQNSALRATLAQSKAYVDLLMTLSDHLGAWIEAAQSSGDINANLPAELVLYTLFARACDPVLGLLKAGGQYSDDTIVELIITTCFNGLAAR